MGDVSDGSYAVATQGAGVGSSILGAVVWLLSLFTIRAPLIIYNILSYSLTLQLNFPSLFFLLLAIILGIFAFIKYRYLNKYSLLREPPLEKSDSTELHPDVVTESLRGREGLGNYLDEFLKAIRIFGFLEKPVFHELARHLETRRLMAGDTLQLTPSTADKSFFIVVDGAVEVFAESSLSESKSRTDEDEGDRWQLINEVRSGGTLSSLFTILSLFTEGIQLRYDESASRPSTGNLNFAPPLQTPDRGEPVRSPIPNSEIPAFSLNSHAPSPNISSPRFRAEGSPDREAGLEGENAALTVARAKVDTTLAVIPAAAFKKLTKKFPKASAHIVQVILTRFSRVTFATAHRFLGLTHEVIQTEKAINELACYPLPPEFYSSGGMARLRGRFAPDGSVDEDDSEQEEDYFNVRLSSNTNSPPKPSAAALAGGPTPLAPIPQRPNHRRAPTGRKAVHAGDLLSMTHSPSENFPPAPLGAATPRPSRQQRAAAQTGNQSADIDLREEVMNSIAKSIGLFQTASSPSQSAVASPRLPSTESMMQRAALGGSGLGNLSMLDMGDDESMAESSVIGGAAQVSKELENEVEILFFEAGSTLVKAGETAGLFFVIDGFLDVSVPPDDEPSKPAPTPTARDATPKLNPRSSNPPSRSRTPAAGSTRFPPSSFEGTPELSSDSIVDGPTAESSKPDNRPLFTVRPGGIAGYLSSLSGIASYVDIKAKTDAYVGFLPTPALERIMERKPIVLLTLAKRLISLLSPLVLQIDSALDWTHVSAGQIVYRAGDPSDSFHIIINGRLRSMVENPGGGIDVLGEYGQGQSVGELDVITGSPRPSTLHAIRDTELVRMPMTLFNAISLRHPGTTIQLLRMIASRVRKEVGNRHSLTPRMSALPGVGGRNNFNLKTVAILPSHRHIPVAAFANKLKHALEDIGASTSYLNQEAVMTVLGRHAFSKMGKLKIAGWLAEQEQKYKIVLYVADTAISSPWTQTCIRQADCIFLVGAGDDPTVGEYERLLLAAKTTARKELILLHPERYVVPGSTRAWLQNRSWLHAHHHVEFPDLPVRPAPVLADPLKKIKDLKQKVETEIRRYRGRAPGVGTTKPLHQNDFARLARRLTGKSVGVVLGGGGARGISHLGVLRAMEEHGIPVDVIGGTSIGAFVGGLYAREANLISSTGRTKAFSGRMNSIWRILSDVTYPVVAYTTGHEFNRGVYKAFLNTHIEDMWIPYFCNSTNITWSRMDVHTSGYAWRYVRASMTLAGFLPPLCEQGSMLVDGGYVDNLPVSTILSMGVASVFAVDVGRVDDTSPRSYSESISGWWILLNRFNPFSEASKIPSMAEIQGRLAYVSSVKTLEEAKSTPGVHYLQMPVQNYGTLQFGKFNEILDVGYKAGQEMLRKLGKEGKLPVGTDAGWRAVETSRTRGRRERRNSI